MKKLTVLLLAAALCLGLCAPAFAADGGDTLSGSCGKYLIWTFDKTTGTLTISGKGGMDYWSGDPRRDPSPWQGFIQEIRAVVIEEGVTSISMGAFCYAVNLTRVEIPKSVTEIGPAAFKDTLWLKSLGEFAVVNGILFEYQGDGGRVVIPEGVTGITSNAFSENRTITSMIIPEGVTALGQAAFQNCENLAEIDFPTTLRRIGAFCFEGTKWLDEQLKKSDLAVAGNVVLEYHGDGGNVVIPEGVVTLADNAFGWFIFAEGTLDSITVPASMLDLNADRAFTSYWPPKSVTYEGGVDQWNKVENTQWLTENNIPVHCIGVTDPARVFSDMETNAFYLKGVAWAVQNEVTTGKTATTFAPKENCTHGQILTFLWRAAGKPESSVVLPFAVKDGAYYLEAAKWGYERGMIGKTFYPDAICNRVDAVNYIWQAQNKPYEVYDGRFTDVPANSPYAQAVAWAVQNNVTTGATADTFDPNGICNRGQIVTFLERAYNK